MDNPKKTMSLLATATTTETFHYMNARFGRAPSIKLIRATGGHGSSKMTHYIPEAAYYVPFHIAATNSATTYYVAVDVAAGHVINGHTLTTSDFVLLPGSNGWQLQAVTSVTDDAGELHCHFAVGTTAGRAVTVRDKFYIIRAAMVLDLTIGSATIEKTVWYTQDVNTPICISTTSGDATDVTGLVSIEFEDPA